MKGAFVRSCLFLLGLGCCVSAYRGSVPRGGSYSLPSIGRYPAPTPTFPGRDHGLPPVYHGKFKRSIADENSSKEDGILDLEEPLEYQKFKRSIDEEVAPEESVVEAFDDTQDLEKSRTRRSSGYRLIQPTYRPPPRRPQKPIYV